MDIQSIIDGNSGAGHHFFDEDTMEKFGTLLFDDLAESVDGVHVYFVTSDLDFNGDRFYKVRVFSKDTLAIWTPYSNGDGMSFESYDPAFEKAEALAKLPR